MKHAHLRNVPRADPDGIAREVCRRREATMHGSASRLVLADPDGVLRPASRADAGKFAADAQRRVTGTNGSWPAAGVAPKPPAICALYEDLNVTPEHGAPPGVFGQYPRALIPKILPYLHCRRHEVLHVCSGALPPGEGIRVDIRPEAKPDIVADGRYLPFADGSQAAVMIDPPYTVQYARDLYGVEYPRPSHLLREALRVVRPGGRIVFVHYLVPMPPKYRREKATLVKVFGLSTGFGFPIRAVTVFEREHALLPGMP